MCYSELDTSNFDVANLLAGATAANVNATTLGLKWITSLHTRFLLNYIKTDFKDVAGAGVLVGGSTNEKAVTFRGQADF